MFKLFIILIVFQVMPSLAEVVPPPYSTIPIVEVFSKRIIRNVDSRLYSGQIKSLDGLKEFGSKFNIDITSLKLNFVNSMYIFGVTDSISTRAFQLLKQEPLYFILDYSDTGIKYKLRKPEKGKKHSLLQIFKVKKIQGISHVKVKNLVSNGLSYSYD